MTLYPGCEVRYKGNKYTVVRYGAWGVRLFSDPDCHLVVGFDDLEPL
jgi:hypothetical protein